MGKGAARGGFAPMGVCEQLGVTVLLFTAFIHDDGFLRRDTTCAVELPCCFNAKTLKDNPPTLRSPSSNTHPIIQSPAWFGSGSHMPVLRPIHWLQTSLR